MTNVRSPGESGQEFSDSRTSSSSGYGDQHPVTVPSYVEPAHGDVPDSTSPGLCVPEAGVSAPATDAADLPTTTEPTTTGPATTGPATTGQSSESS